MVPARPWLNVTALAPTERRRPRRGAIQGDASTRLTASTAARSSSARPRQAGLRVGGSVDRRRMHIECNAGQRRVDRRANAGPGAAPGRAGPRRRPRRHRPAVPRPRRHVAGARSDAVATINDSSLATAIAERVPPPSPGTRRASGPRGTRRTFAIRFSWRTPIGAVARAPGHAGVPPDDAVGLVGPSVIGAGRAAPCRSAPDRRRAARARCRVNAGHAGLGVTTSLDAG